MYHFIINPAARSGLGEHMWKKLEPLLKQRRISYQAVFTRYQSHATKIAEEITSDGDRHTLIVLGGDGTVNEVINGIVKGDPAEGAVCDRQRGRSVRILRQQAGQ